MKFFLQHSILFLACLCLSSVLMAQGENLSEKFKEQTINTLSEQMNAHYVFPEVAKQTVQHLNQQWKEGHFKQFQDLESFAVALTESVQSINKDKHMRIRPTPVYEAPENTPERRIEEQLDHINRIRSITGGFYAAKKLKGNIGYLDLRGFAPLHRGQPVADNYMALLATSDAIIVDLRKNGGGSPAMVQYLCSYFFDEKVHLNSLYWRRGDETEEFWTLDEVGGEKMPDVPLFVLTSSRTFSGAEEFSYNMQTRKRAILVGETTGGGANPGDRFRLNADLEVFIPTGRAINPVTKTNWEGVGVEPEVPTEAEAALDKALELAQEAAEEFRNKADERKKKLLMNLAKALDTDASASQEMIIRHVSNCQEAGLLEEGSINMLGYEYLTQHKQSKTAAALFKANMLLYPQSANVYDSYAESLLVLGDGQGALEQYQKAVDIAKKSAHPDVEMFQANLDKAKKQLSGR